MKKRIVSVLLCLTMSVAMLAGCGGKSSTEETQKKQETTENS